jgi:hypothetical protein
MTQETHMPSTRRKLAAILISAGAIALATEQAHAWGGTYYGRSYGLGPYAFAYRPYAANFTYRPPYAYRSYYGDQPLYAYRPYFRAAYAAAPLYGAGYETYSYYPSSSYYPSWTGYYGSGTFSDGRRVPGTNYNPNQ